MFNKPSCVSYTLYTTSVICTFKDNFLCKGWLSSDEIGIRDYWAVATNFVFGYNNEHEI